MRPLPHEGTAEGGLCCSLLRLVQSDRQIQQLREELGGFSHRCRNLLNGMKMSLYFMRRGAEQPLPQWWNGLELNYRGIEELLDQLQAIYRPISLTLVRGAFRCLVQDRQRLWSDWFASGCGTLEIVPPEQESAGEFDPMCLTMGFDALARWRASAVSAGQSARISWRTGDDQFEVSWHESGGTARADPAARANQSGFTVPLGGPPAARLATLGSGHDGSPRHHGMEPRAGVPRSSALAFEPIGSSENPVVLTSTTQRYECFERSLHYGLRRSVGAHSCT